MKLFIELIKPYFKKPWFFKLAFNLSPMYRRSTGRILSVSDNLFKVIIKIPLNYKNRNYMGTIFGGSLFSATDPILMIQIVQILGEDYVVWDKFASIKFKIPAKEALYATFELNESEIEHIKSNVAKTGEIDFTKDIPIKNKDGKIYAEVNKVIYVADKEFFKKKRALKKKSLKS